MFPLYEFRFQEFHPSPDQSELVALEASRVVGFIVADYNGTKAPQQFQDGQKCPVLSQNGYGLNLGSETCRRNPCPVATQLKS